MKDRLGECHMILYFILLLILLYLNVLFFISMF